MWGEVLSWRLTRSSVLSLKAGALVMAASLASPRFADAFAFGTVQESVSNGFVTIGNPANMALRQSMDQSVPMFDCSGVAREPTAKTFLA